MCGTSPRSSRRSSGQATDWHDVTRYAEVRATCARRRSGALSRTYWAKSVTLLEEGAAGGTVDGNLTTTRFRRESRVA